MAAGGFVSPLPDQDISSLAQSLWNTIQKMNNPGEYKSILLTGTIDEAVDAASAATIRNKPEEIINFKK